MLTRTHVSRFELREFVGRGAAGDVYLAWDPESAGEVAVKLVRKRIDPELLQAEKNGVSLQRQLAEVAPQVPAVFEQGEDAEFFWVAMEYVAGADLSEVLAKARGPLPEERACHIALQLCEMLETFHELSVQLGGRQISGIVHGDLKPENIRLQEGDRLRVLDFGIAKHLSQTRRFTVNLFGSLPYTPPERLEHGRVDLHSDLWAAGVVLYLMACGYPPYTGNDAEEVETLIRRGAPPRPLPEWVSPPLRKILLRCLQFDVARRYQRAAELRADLEAWRDGRPLPGESAADATRSSQEPREDLNATRRTTAPLIAPLAAAAAATSETRRTDRPAAEPLDATRRTVGEPVPVPPPPVSPPPPLTFPEIAGASSTPAVPAEPGRRRRRWPFIVGVLLILFAGSQFWVGKQAAEIQRALVTDTDPDLLALLNRYQDISLLGVLHPTVGAVRDELREALVAQADRVIRSYHGDTPKVRERGWQSCYDSLRGAAQLNYLDRGVRARMVYCRAHLDRIQAQTLRGRGEKEQADTLLDKAIEEYRDAARRDKNWPDPYLGLARVYSYERFDLEELQKTLVELERRGYRMGRRETAMLGDGNLMQAEALWSRAGRARGTEGERELLEQTRVHLLQALNFYEEVPTYAGVPSNRAKAARRLDEVEARLGIGQKPAREEEPGFLDDLFGAAAGEILEEIQKQDDGDG